MSNELIMYIVVNKDLNMSKGKIAAQASHTCTEYLIKTLTGDNQEEKNRLFEWYNDCQKKIVLGAHQNVLEKLEKEGKYFPVRDCGFTEIPENSLTAICLGVKQKDEISNVTKRLQLLK